MHHAHVPRPGSKISARFPLIAMTAWAPFCTGLEESAYPTQSAIPEMSPLISSIQRSWEIQKYTRQLHQATW
eukprot:1138278-Pelagomonas_calceolata.AAC.1